MGNQKSFHKITEWLELEPWRSSSSIRPALGRDTFHWLSQALKGPLGIEGTTISMGNLCQSLTNLMEKNYLLISNLNPLFSNQKPFPLALSLHALAPPFSKFLQGTGRLQLGHPEALCFPGWTILILSAFPHRRGSPSLWSVW